MDIVKPKPILQGKLSVLDGARGLAILLVVCFHYVPGFDFGWMGVDLFFVLSGFLITGKLLESVGQTRYFSRFYINRILRIVPLYYVVLFLFFVVLPMVADSKLPQSYKDLSGIQGYYWTFTVNFYNAFHGWTENITIVHFWSLAVEMQFYFLWPFVILLLYRNRRLLISVLLILMFAALMFRLFGQELVPSFHSIYTYTLLLSRLDAFCAGSLLYVIISNRLLLQKRRILGWVWPFVLVLILVSGWLRDLNWHYAEDFVRHYGYLLNAGLWFFLLIQCLESSKSIVKNIFQSRILTTLGKYSYAIYIFHLPVWIFYSKLEGLTEMKQPYRELALILLSALTSFLLSLISFYLLEKPFLSLKPKSK